MSKKNQKKESKPQDYNAIKERDMEKKQREKEEKQKSSKRKVMQVTAAVLAVCALGGGIYGVRYAMQHKNQSADAVILETENFKVDAAMFSCYFQQCENSYLEYAEGNDSMPMFDADTSLRNQQYSEEQTWFDMFMENTLQSVEANLRVCEAAHAANYELDEETKQQCKTAAEETDLSQYPGGITTDDLERAMQLTFLAQKFQEQMNQDAEYSDQEIEAYFDANRENYLTASVMAYSFPWDPQGIIAEDYTEYNAAITNANNMMDCRNEQEFKEYVYQYLTEEKELSETEASNMSEDLMITNFVSGFPAAVQEWLNGDAAENETWMHLKEEQCSTTVYMLRQKPFLDTADTVDFRIIFLSAGQADQLENVEAMAEQIQEYVQFSESPSETFASYAQQYSADSATKNKGGYVKGYSECRTTYGDEITEWAFDDSRKAGDMAIISRSSAVILAYFEQKNGEAGWKSAVENDLQTNRYNEYTALRDSFEITRHEDQYQNIME
ncbi:MAG: peptidyl-prolyl cis-trans isomerase [Oscillospiraceae bacterium]|nr:peptidyl-prolyl cis-trans isomerase [Oscillospiraceae bacterium]